MPAVRTKVRVRKSSVFFVEAIHFSLASSRYARRSVCIISPPSENLDSPSFPAVEHILGTSYQIHDTTITIQDQHNVEHGFLVSYQHDLSLPVNRSLSQIAPGGRWNGELIVMKRGRRRFVRNLRTGCETRLALAALQRFMDDLRADGGVGVLNPNNFPTEFWCELH